MKKIDFRKLIKAGLKKQKITVPQIARLLGMNHQIIYNYLNDKTEMTSGNLEKIFEKLKIKVITEGKEDV